MIIKDNIYGNFEIISPAIIELINSKPVQRLKNIAQYGVPDEFYHLREGRNRFEHSLGVMLLLKYLGAGEKEQIAGLLHDVSHTAFSHVVDHLFSDGIKEDYQDKQHADFINNSEITSILKKYHYNPPEVTNYKIYKLLEQDIPNLCADRLDYSLREFSLPVAKKILKQLTVFNQKIVFKDEKTAFLFADNFLNKQLAHWGGFEAVSRYKVFASILKRALEQKIIKKSDLYKDDNYVVNILKGSPDEIIKARLQILKNISLTHLPKSSKKYHKKFRHVDPQFIKNGRLIRLSSINKKFKKLLKKTEENNALGINIAVVA